MKDRTIVGGRSYQFLTTHCADPMRSRARVFHAQDVLVQPGGLT